MVTPAAAAPSQAQKPKTEQQSAPVTQATQSSQPTQAGSVVPGCGNGIDVAETQKMIAFRAKNPDGSPIRVCNI